MKKRALTKTPSKLNWAIYRCLGKSASFESLENEERYEVLRFIKEHNVKAKAFGKRGFDVLRQLFFAEQYDLDESGAMALFDLTFPNFSNYYSYLDGDIFENACYFGYKMDPSIAEENEKLGFPMNFGSFSSDVIDEYSYQEVRERGGKGGDASYKKNEAILSFIASCPFPKSPESFLSQLDEIRNCFGLEARDWYLNKLVNEKRAETEAFCVSALCHYGNGAGGLLFPDVFSLLGVEAGKRILANYSPKVADKTLKKHVKELEFYIKHFSSPSFHSKTLGNYDSDQHLYRVERRYYDGDALFLRRRESYFRFEDACKAVKGNWSDFDLSLAPIHDFDVFGFKINENTQTPLPYCFEEQRVKKGYDEDRFFVIQSWHDKQGKLLLSKTHLFSYFCDFCHFLHGDLSNADLILCDGVKNLKDIPHLRLSGLKARSEDMEALGLTPRLIPCPEPDGFAQSQNYELKTVSAFLEERPSIHQEGERRIAYISDIHLEHRFYANHCRSEEDRAFVLRRIVSSLGENPSGIVLIAGDAAHEFGNYENLIADLSPFADKKRFFFTLGNHELWGFPGKSLPEIVSLYRALLENNGMYLLQNNAYLFLEDGIKEISETEMSERSVAELRGMARGAYLILFGGIGFSGKNQEFNASQGIYRNSLSREEEIRQSAHFDSLYKKALTAFDGMNLIVLTHMPPDCFSEYASPKQDVVYVHGHDHKNYFHDDGETRIYADNQIGYRGKEVHLKSFSVAYDYDWFSAYEDGIHKITAEDYRAYYRGINEPLSFNRPFEKLYMLKRDGAYLFLMQNKKGELLLLNGGAIKKLNPHTLSYFYESMGSFQKSIEMFLSPYSAYQQGIASEVKSFGGEGNIHGCIVDIDFYNHLFINPFDGNIVPYSAGSIKDKEVYPNLASLFNERRPDLLPALKALMRQKGRGTLLESEKQNTIIQKGVHDESTDIYRISRIIKNHQTYEKHSLIRIWSDSLVEGCSTEKGEAIIKQIAYPDADIKRMAAPVTRRKDGAEQKGFIFRWLRKMIAKLRKR